MSNSVSPPHGDLHLIFIDDQIGSGENVWDDTCLPLNFLLLKPHLIVTKELLGFTFYKEGKKKILQPKVHNSQILEIPTLHYPSVVLQSHFLRI